MTTNYLLRRSGGCVSVGRGGRAIRRQFCWDIRFPGARAGGAGSDRDDAGLPDGSDQHPGPGLRINNYSTVEDAQAFSYKIGGHSMYEITFPTAGETWIYDGLSQCWSQVDRQFAPLAELSCNYRNGIYVTDYRTGDILRLDPMSMTDNGEAIIRTIRALLCSG